MVCLNCRSLIKAIDAYIQKADNDLSNELGAQGFLEPEKTVEYMREIEDGVEEVLLEETDYILSEVEKAVDLVSFSKDVWPDVKLNDVAREKLATVFIESFDKFMPEFVNYYLSWTDKGLKLEQISKRTTSWIKTWSRDLGDLMQLNSHNEIERILTKGLKEGKGVAAFTREILDSGIRDEYYKARRVAVTEVLRAHSVAQQEAFMQSPAVGEKMWRHTGSYRNDPRKNHVKMDGQRVPVDKPFELSGINGGTHRPMYPRDTVLPPEESINCHCICQPVVDEDILGLSLEERQRLQQQAIDEMDDEWEKELDARNKAKAGIEVGPYSTDATRIYTEKATPGKGKITYGEGYKKGKHKGEIDKARFLHDTFGGDIEVLTEANSFGEKTPDYRWNGKLWELKTVTTEKSADGAVRTAIKQIWDEPGGIILDYENNEISIKKLREVLMSRFKRSGLDSLDVMVLTHDKTVVNVYRHKK